MKFDLDDQKIQKRKKTFLFLFVNAMMSLFLFVGIAHAQQNELPLYFNGILANHPEVLALESNLEASEKLLLQAKDAYYPTLSLNGSYGFERTERKNKQSDGSFSDPRKTDLSPSDLGLELRENLFRGGGDVARIEKQEISVEKARLDLENTRQDILLRMISAYVNVQRYEKLLELARLSTENIQRQAELESTRIERGRGYNTDLLQAKAQLVEAEARKVRAERGFTQSVDVYRNLFDHIPTLVNAVRIVIPEVALPENLDTAVGRAISNSLLIQLAKNNILVAEEERKEASANRLGALDLVGGVRTRNNTDGAEANTLNYYAQLEYSLNLKIPSFDSHTVEFGDAQIEVNAKRMVAIQRNVLLDVRKAWSDFDSAREISELEADRADIAEEFLNLARRERDLNRRSLLEVLNGETNLYAARIQSISASADAVIASYSLLKTMGLLRVGVITVSPQNNT